MPDSVGRLPPTGCAPAPPPHHPAPPLPRSPFHPPPSAGARRLHAGECFHRQRPCRFVLVCRLADTSSQRGAPRTWHHTSTPQRPSPLSLVARSAVGSSESAGGRRVAHLQPPEPVAAGHWRAAFRLPADQFCAAALHPAQPGC